MKLSTNIVGSDFHAKIIGNIDVDSAPLLREQVQERWTPDIRQMFVDLSDVDYLSSAGIALLLEWRQKTARDNVTFLVTAVSSQVREVLETCRLDRLLLADPTGSGPASASA